MFRCDAVIREQGAGFSTATDSLEAIRDRGDAAWAAGTGANLLVDTTIATVTSQTVFTLSAGPADDDALNNQSIVLYDASSTPADSPSVRKVTDYVAATKTVTIDAAADFVMVAADKVKIFVTPPHTTAPTTAQVADAVWDEDLSAHQTAASAGEELHVAKAVVANKRTHDTGSQVDSIVDNNGVTLLRTMTPVSDAATGIITVTPS